ncbi:cysteine desulfurase [Lachnospiraceae bacterium CLA-AA-H215]|uniref:cysteine desulfurase n=1 Tax=Hominifimenecus microfluidus TaxID=2885348 RepID=A0AAE3ED87_9FIRM|nr:cysteine desulfurase family protein [Hominifimenecus microfluidus]MCC2231695.1 cysteine desulfurase [Hominifimenecus microfluidus]
MEIYFDNSATTPVFPCVREVMMRTMEDDFGNPSSMHRKGMDAENYIRTAKTQIAKTLKVDEKEILFTSGGTESNNTAILGTVSANPRLGKHLITSAIEHPSVANTMHWLEGQGYRVTYLPVDHEGRISLEDLAAAIDDETVLVSIMMVNNEIGTREPIEEISRVIKEKNLNTIFHVDAVQAYGKYVIRPKKWGIDLMSVSGHKIHGPKGIGFLYIRDKVKINPIIFGGEQQKGLRSGTENVPGIAGLGAAAEEIYREHESRTAYLYGCKSRMTEGLLQLEGVTVNGPAVDDGAPHVVSASFAGVRSEVLLHALEDKGIYVSAGSACASNHPGLSSTLVAIGLDPKLLDCTLRFSFSIFTTEEEVDETLKALKELLPFLRKYTRK